MHTATLTVLALSFGLAAATAAAAEPAQCSYTGTLGTLDKPCDITWRGGGSLSAIVPSEGGGEATPLMLDLRPTGAAQASVDPPGPTPVVTMGTVQRDPADAACWLGEDFRACFRAVDAAAPGTAVGEPPPGKPALPTDTPVRFVARCHMDACIWVEQSGTRQIGEGSDAVPGRLMETTQRMAFREYPGGEYPDDIPANLTWDAPVQAQYFCSPIRPAIKTDDGWQVLPLPEIYGATEGATSGYIRVCHPQAARPDPYDAIKGLNYQIGGDIGRIYPDFAALTGG